MSNGDIIPLDNNSAEITPKQPTPLEIAGQIANKIAGNHIFERYLSEKSINTIKRHGRDLELFAEYLTDAGIPLSADSDFQRNPFCWQGVTWGLVEGFVQWQLNRSYAVSSVNARLSTVRIYARLAVKAGAIERNEGILISSVKGFSRQGGLNVDEQRVQTRKKRATYTYSNGDGDRPVKVTRRSTKKKSATLLTEQQAKSLKRVRNKSEQAWRDAMLMCLLIDHGLRASEVAILKASAIDLETKEMRFFRPKVKGTRHEWTTHQLTPTTYDIASVYLQKIYPPDLKPDGPLILGTTRLLKNGEGGYLLGEGLNRVRLSERVSFLAKHLGIQNKVSAHDCRHTCATAMARIGYSVDELMAWFGWTSAQTAMRYIADVDVKERYRG